MTYTSVRFILNENLDQTLVKMSKVIYNRQNCFFEKGLNVRASDRCPETQKFAEVDREWGRNYNNSTPDEQE